MEYTTKTAALSGFESRKIARARSGDHVYLESERRNSLIQNLLEARMEVAAVQNPESDDEHQSPWRLYGFQDDVVEGYMEVQMLRYESTRDDASVSIIFQKRAQGINGYEGITSDPWLVASITRSWDGTISVQTPQLDGTVPTLRPIDVNAYLWQDIEDIAKLFLYHSA